MVHAIEIHTEDITLPFYELSESDILRYAECILSHALSDPVEMAIVCTSDNYIRTVNRDYRQKDYPTDVISFAFRDEPFPTVDGPEMLGDCIISLERARAQSEEYHVSLREEMLRLMVHGILHLLGYDHEAGPEEERQMHQEEDRLIALCRHCVR